MRVTQSEFDAALRQIGSVLDASARVRVHHDVRGAYASVERACGGGDLVFVYHIALNESYGVPQLLVSAESSTGEPLAASAVLARMSADARVDEQWLAQDAHPHTGAPCCALHHCGTSDMLDAMLLPQTRRRRSSSSSSEDEHGSGGGSGSSGSGRPTGAPPTDSASAHVRLLRAWVSLVNTAIGCAEYRVPLRTPSASETVE